MVVGVEVSQQVGGLFPAEEPLVVWEGDIVVFGAGGDVVRGYDYLSLFGVDGRCEDLRLKALYWFVFYVVFDA